MSNQEAETMVFGKLLEVKLLHKFMYISIMSCYQRFLSGTLSTKLMVNLNPQIGHRIVTGEIFFPSKYLL